MSQSSETLTNIQIQSDLDRLRQLMSEIDVAAGRQQQTMSGTESQIFHQASADLNSALAPARRTLQNLEKRLAEQERERDQLRALQDIGAAMNSALDPNDVLRIVMDTIIELAGAERGFLMLIDDNTDEIEVVQARNINKETISDQTEVSSTVINSVLESGEALLTTNAQADPRFSGQESIINYNLRSILCVPLNLKDDTIGVIYADNRIADGIFRDAERELLVSFANQAAVAIENARLFRQIRSQLAEITEMKTLMDDVFASITSGVITINNQDEIALYNSAAGRILGVPGSQVESRPYQEVLNEVNETLENEVTDRVDQVKQEGKTQSCELDVSIQRRQGTTSLALNLSPLLNMQQRTHGVAMVLDDISEKKRLESVRRYLPPALVDQVRDVDAAQRPLRRPMTFIFADINGFSTFSENLDPERLIEIINRYFTIAAQAINENEGIIDKFMGDAVMALFNTQLNPQEDHPERAVRTALAMKIALDEYQANMPENEKLSFGVGIHTGEAVAGNVGSSFRKDFTAIGDAVNLAKRLEETAVGAEIIISSDVYEAVKEWVVVEAREPMKVKGRDTLEQTYRLISEQA